MITKFRKIFSTAIFGNWAVAEDLRVNSVVIFTAITVHEILKNLVNLMNFFKNIHRLHFIKNISFYEYKLPNICC